MGRVVATGNQRWMLPFVSLGLPLLLLPLGAPSSVVRGFSLLAFALAGWAGGWLDPTVVSLLIVVLTPFLGLGTFQDAVSGYGQPFVWLLVSTFILSNAVETSGFGRRIALGILRTARGRSGPSLLAMFMTVVVLGFLIPSTVARSAIILPICASLATVIHKALNSDVAPGDEDATAIDNFGRAMFLGVGFVGISTAWALMTGSISSVYVAATVKDLTGYQWTYIQWIAACLPILLIFVVLLWFMLLRLYPPGFHQIPGGLAFIQAESSRLGRLSAEERRIGLILAGTLLLWLTEPLHGISVAHAGMLAATLSCIPVLGVQDWATAGRGVKWEVVILFGAGYSLASSLVRSGTAIWIAERMTGIFPEVPAWAAALVLIATITLVRLGFANLLAIVSVFLPIALSLSRTWDLNGVWLAQIALIASSFGFFLPVQTPSTLMAHGYGYFTVPDMMRSGLIALLILIPLTLLFALYVWPILGIRPF